MKILIIGGGPAGATAARFLAKNHDVTLIQDRIWDKPCGGGVKTKIFDEYGLDKNIIKHLQNKVYMIYRDKRIEIPLKGENLAIVKRMEFDRHLRDLAVENKTKLIFGRFKKFEENIAVVDINGEKVRFEYDILIAADGVNSTVRKALNLPDIPKTITHYAKTDEYKTEYCEFFFDEDIGGKYYAWAFPHRDKTHIGTVSKENFDNLCKYLNVNVKPKGYFIPTWQKNIQIQKDNVFFVGDAAGQVMPLSFEGIYYAIKSAEILAKSINEGLNYKKEWDKRFLRDFKLMKFLETLHTSSFRKWIIKAHKFSLVKNLSISLWLKGT